MTFIRAVPGPSKLPLGLGRRAFSRSVPATAKTATATSSDGTSESTSGGRAETEAGAVADWLSTAGQQYARPTSGSRAAWLGGSVPYASNPSFRPPPPLSNKTQDIIMKALRRGDKTVGQIAEEYHVSKARIEAIRKLKDVEAELKRQSLPLQSAFLNAMEPLLGVYTPQPKSQQSRSSDWTPHQSVGIERDEENRLEAGIGAQGAFADRGSANAAKQGLERVAFEWRDEETMIAERRSEARARAGIEVSNEAEAKVAEQAAAPETPEHEAEMKREESKPIVASARARLVPSASGRAGYRFIDTSSRSGSSRRR